MVHLARKGFSFFFYLIGDDSTTFENTSNTGCVLVMLYQKTLKLILKRNKVFANYDLISAFDKFQMNASLLAPENYLLRVKF